MILNEELLAVQRGEQGEAMRKVLNTLVMYGEAFGAERMVKITGWMGHSVKPGGPRHVQGDLLRAEADGGGMGEDGHQGQQCLYLHRIYE